MEAPGLINRTERFASSVKILDVIQTPKGYPSFGYTYLKYPYQTFEPGQKQGSVDRDPRRLIDRTIREIAAEYAVGRLFTRGSNIKDINRAYANRRLAIVDALTEKLKEINGTGEFNTDVYDNVTPRLKFWDEEYQFRTHLNAGAETREYQSAGYKDRFLSVTIRIYVKEEDSVVALEGLAEDVETIVEKYSLFHI